MNTLEPPYTLDRIQRAAREGAYFKYVFFWGHTPKEGNSRVGHECLSQWYPAAFEVDGVAYATSEHYMMAMKAVTFEDQDALERILAASHPGEAKKIGRQVQGYDDATWAACREEHVYRGNIAKFSQNPELSDVLLRTHSRVLVEASPVDRVWGIGLAAQDVDASDPSRWRGENLLGFVLMAVRDELQNHSAPNV